ncbi:hypothetical protein [Halogeometricum borinquense]|uniref:hypothetical protein n=1 Tax=Halogeometricum borinquense TaxID=60847 RepID=UPI00342B8A8A
MPHQYTRRQLLGYSTVGVTTLLAGCSGAEIAKRSEETEPIELRGGQYAIFHQHWENYVNFEYTANIVKDEEGYSSSGPVNILFMNRHSFVRWLNDEHSQDDFHDISSLDVSGEIDVSGVIKPGIYYLLVDNTNNERDAEVNIGWQANVHTGDIERDCSNSQNDAEIRNLEVHKEQPPILSYHILIPETKDSEYSLSMEILSSESEATVTETGSSEVCSTHFVDVIELSELDVQIGERLEVRLTIESDGEVANELEQSINVKSSEGLTGEANPEPYSQ